MCKNLYTPMYYTGVYKFENTYVSYTSVKIYTHLCTIHKCKKFVHTYVLNTSVKICIHICIIHRCVHIRTK